jgi:Rrf2 family transcriptional regulator, cysteine metabolism repressor
MALLSRKTDYALLILAYLQRQEGGASAREIADQYQLSRPFVANILKELTQRGYVASQRGVKGGYTLTRSAGSITIKELLVSLEDGFRFSSCVDGGHDHEACGMESICPIKSPIQELHRRLLEVLERVTVADLLQSPPSAAAAGLTLLTVRTAAPAALSQGI